MMRSVLRKKKVNNGGDNKNNQYHQSFGLAHLRRYFTQARISREDRNNPPEHDVDTLTIG
jgi:hypothetical protein